MPTAAAPRTVHAVGHRGDPHRVRENTLDSLRSAFARGADAVEVDVRLTADGVPVLLHDESFRRLWKDDRPLVALTADEVYALSAGGVPTLREALDATAGAGRVMIDLPGASAGTVRAVVQVVRDCGARERTYYCAGPATMLKVRAADPGAEIAMTWTSLCPPRRSLVEALAPRWLNYRFGVLSRELVDALHADGLLVSAWTADTKRTMRRLVDLGVDSVTTNRVDALVAVRAAAGARGPAD
ncbi:glycerophosphodiester phosphodiesterase [Streptomyces sp. NRRL S-87]|uniref:glycerophosphodiester phosphodiesterase n=1 Tax=Streptomyces sp. NRRL S-87 TaxID=1463920 RepID=UPI0004BFDA39|nr:glycerophosphodiester phosphodiesterase [Streptomyces sp. NRRL S-87]